MSNFIVKLDRFLSSAAINTAAVLMGLMALLVFFQVVTRFVFDAPSTWSEITARIMMVWMVYISMGCAFSKGSMITINFFADILPSQLNLWLRRIVTLLVLAFLAILIGFGWSIAERVQGQNVAMLNISAFWMYISIPIGAVLAVPSVLAWHIVNVERQPTPHSNTTTAPTKAAEV